MSAIVFDGDNEEHSWCDLCDARLFQRKDGSMICSNSDCCKVYPAGSINKHKRSLEPIEDPYDNSPDSGPLLISMTEYTNKKRKKPTVWDKEDKIFEGKSGRYFTTHEDWPPEEPEG
jgi:uncharacterized Zn finger protein (UPF0148 family)